MRGAARWPNAIAGWSRRCWSVRRAMPRKSFSFGPPARERALSGEAAISEVDREILKKTVDDGVRVLENARVVPIGRVHPDPEQPRRSMDDTALAELAASVRA